MNNSEKKKILFYGYSGDSHAYRNVLVCKDLLDSGRYNVTILIPTDYKYIDEIESYGINYYAPKFKLTEGVRYPIDIFTGNSTMI